MKKPARNFLEMVPVRKVQEFTREGDRITLLIPKFKSEWMLKWPIPSRRSKHFRIHLDEMGSRVWDLIDGTRNTGEICAQLEKQIPETNATLDIRVTGFLRQLYKNRFIIFKQ